MAALTQIGVQYMPSTGACMLDMAAVPTNLFDACSAIHIIVPEAQHDIDVNSGMICIKPSQPANPMLASYREQYFYPPLPVEAPLQQQQQQQQQSPVSSQTPPSIPIENGNGDSSKPSEMPNIPVASPGSQSPSIQTLQAEPTVQTLEVQPTVQTQEARPSVHTEELRPVTPSTTSSCTSSMMFVTSTFLTQVTASVSIYRGQLSTFSTTTPSTSPTVEVHIPTPSTTTPPTPPAPVPASPTLPSPIRPAPRV